MVITPPERLKHFTDREPHIAAFDDLWANSTLWVLLFTGVSGNGKSTLIDWLITYRCQPQGIRWVKIDLFNGLNPAVLLDNLAELLPPNAAEHYHATRDAAARDYEQARQNLLLAAAARPIQAIQQASDHSQISQAEIRIQTGQAQAQEELTRIYHDRLSAALATELLRPSPKQAIIFLDTYERAQENSPEAQLAWLWHLLEAAFQARPNLRLIVASREDIAYPPAKAWRSRHPLEAFSAADSDRFLVAWSEGQIPPDLRAAIFELTRGHPLLTEMAAELWRDGQQAGRPLTQAELRAGLEHRSAEEWLYGRIINRLEALGDARLVAAARYGPLLRGFTLRSLNALLPEAIGRLDDKTFRRFSGYAFVKSTPTGWAFHELMRDVQRAYLARQDDSEVETCHHRAMAFFQERAEASRDPEAARNTLYHACFLKPDGVFDQADDETFRAQLAGEREWWGELLGALEAPAQFRRLEPIQQGRLCQRRGMWHVRDYNMSTALASYAQALDLFRAVGDRLGEANISLALGHLARSQGDLPAARNHAQAALNVFLTMDNAWNIALALWDLGDVEKDAGNHPIARENYQKALALLERIGAPSAATVRARLQALETV
jgi:hypothetical protein